MPRPRPSPTRRPRRCRTAAGAGSARVCGRPRPRTLIPRSRRRSASAARHPPTTLTAAVRARAAARATAHTAARADEIPSPRRSIRRPGLCHRADRVLPRAPGKSAEKPCVFNHFPGLLVLRGSRGKSTRFSWQLNDLPCLLVLRSVQEDSAEMARKIGPHDTEFVLREIPGEVRKRRRQNQWRDRRRRRVGEHTPMLQAMGDEVVGITTTPGGLCLRAARDLTRRGRTGTLATANAVVRHKPSATDAAGPLREHPRMLASTAGNQSGPLLASNPGSILASAEVPDAEALSDGQVVPLVPQILRWPIAGARNPFVRSENVGSASRMQPISFDGDCAR